MINDLVDGNSATSNNNSNNSTIFGTTNPNNSSLMIGNELLFANNVLSAANTNNNGNNGQPAVTLGSLEGMSPESMAALAASLGLAPQLVQAPSKGQQNGDTGGSSSSLNGQQQQQYSLEYLAQLLKDKKSLNSLPNIFLHVERLIDDEISRVRTALFHAELSTKEALVLPEPNGNVVMLQEKIYVPVKDYPDYNFVGRILGPRGMTAKQLEQETGCKIMVRGKGSMRDKKKEDANRGKPNWEHLNDELHVLLQCEDTENRAAIKLKRGCEELRKLLMPAPEGEDDLKRKQLMELAIINGTFRTQNQNKANLQTQLLSASQMTAAASNALRTPTLGAPIYLSPGGARFAAAVPTTAQSLAAAFPSLNFDLNAAAAAAGLILPMDQILSLSAASAFPYSAAALNPQLFAGDYISADSQAGAILNQRRLLNQAREHPYQRPNA